ncbi:MAG: fatty acid desaturase [Bacteriovoracaceae bacterium]|nr:fatty acid desaturase [Bacteriovoracaceae bacterium]
MTKSYSFKNLDLINTLFLTLTPIMAIVSTVWWIQSEGFSWGPLLSGIFFYIITGLSITAGYHRLFSHKAYEAHPLVKLFFLCFGAAAFQNSIYKWGSDHRLHHSKVDTESDPYNINEGFFYAHIGWIFLKENSQMNEQYGRDFEKDALVMWQHKYYIPIALFFGMILPTLVAGLFFHSYLGGFAVGALCKLVMIHHCTFFINSLCHYVGSTPYTKSNTARDSWYMAYLTFGEGYHNFHHYFQADYRNGVRWYQFDPTKWLVKTLEAIKLASKLKITPDEKILSARLQMKIEQLRERKQMAMEYLQEIEQLKMRILDSLARFEQMKNEFKARGHEKNKEMKMKMELARLDFEYALKQWQLKAV